MLLIFVLIIFVLLHIQFFVRNLLFGFDETNYFQFSIRYLYDQHIAQLSLLFAVSCACVFAVLYLISHRLVSRFQHRLSGLAFGNGYDLPRWPLVVSGGMQVVAVLFLVVKSGFVYQIMAESVLDSGFVFELRMVFLLLLSHLMLNVKLKDLVGSPQYKSVRITVLMYVLALLLLQARSRVFEVVVVIVFSQLMWSGDKIRLKYFAFIGFALLVPNIMVLGRLGWPEDFSVLLDGLFSFEYTILFNNILSAALVEGKLVGAPFTFTPSLGLLLPSPIRSLLEIEIQKSDYYSLLSESAGVGNGGFSLLAEFFSNFGWWAIGVFGCVGAVLGYFNARSLRIGHVSLFASTAPLVYASFILAFRNDLGVFLKYFVQLMMVSSCMNVMIRCRIFPNKFVGAP